VSKLRQELFQSVLPFWYEHSYDEQHAGFYSCLTEEGSVYDRRKFMWLNGRQIWMFSKICLQYSDEDLARLSANRLDRTKMIDMAKQSCEFALSHALRDDQQVFFSLTDDGLPHTFQRKIFAACFLCLGCSGVFAVTKEERYR
jgi:N-acylglucosamine 2-epimerase